MAFIDSNHSKITLTFYVSLSNLCLEIMNPKYTNSFCMKEHFYRFTSGFSWLKLYKTCRLCDKCSHIVLLKISMSSKYTKITFPQNTFITSFIILMNVLGTLVGPNCTTSHSCNPSFILKVVFHSSPYLI